MPKDRRGGRSLKKQPYNDYAVIGDANNGKISVLKAKSATDNASVPQFSNKTNTTYFIAKDVDVVTPSGTVKVTRVTSIAVYRNRKVVYNIDIDSVQGNHYHVWDTKMVRGKVKQVKRKKHDYNLKPVHQKLIQMALDWNNGGN